MNYFVRRHDSLYIYIFVVVVVVVFLVMRTQDFLSQELLKNTFYLFLAVLSLYCCAGFPLVAEESGGYAAVAVCGLLIAVASVVTEPLAHVGFCSLGARA